MAKVALKDHSVVMEQVLVLPQWSSVQVGKFTVNEGRSDFLKLGPKFHLRTAVAYFRFCHVHAAEEHIPPQCLQQVKHLQRSILRKYNIIVSTTVLRSCLYISSNSRIAIAIVIINSLKGMAQHPADTCTWHLDALSRTCVPRKTQLHLYNYELAWI
jgi:hypothetical protein